MQNYVHKGEVVPSSFVELCFETIHRGLMDGLERFGITQIGQDALGFFDTRKEQVADEVLTAWFKFKGINPTMPAEQAVQIAHECCDQFLNLGDSLAVAFAKERSRTLN